MGEGVSLKAKTLTGTIWGALERFGPQGISFLVMIIMARILTPQDYGLVGMVLIFIFVAQSLVDSGFSQALIRKLDRNETDDSTTFYFNIAIGVILYVVMWFLAPVIARFYQEPRLLWLTRIICIGIIFNSLAVVQRALLTIEIDFKTQAIASFFGAIGGGVIGLFMAYSNFGCWSIVAYHIVNLGLNMLLLWILSKWRPKWIFSWSSFRQLFSFGSRLAVAGLLHTLYINGVNMAIGKVYKAADLGYYTRAQQFGAFFSSNIAGILQRVSYPVFCRFQNDNEKLSEIFVKIVRASCFITFCLMFGLAAVAKPMIGMLLGEKWMEAAFLMQILCFAYMWYPLYSLNLNILLVKGRSDLFLKLEIIKKVFFIFVLACLLPLGMKPLCCGIIINSLIEVYVNSYYTKKLIGISIWEQFVKILPSFIYAGTMGLVVLLSSYFILGSFIFQFIICTIIGIAYIFIVTYVTGSKDLKLFISLIKKNKNIIESKS